jgi:hypothetical protein
MPNHSYFHFALPVATSSPYHPPSREIDRGRLIAVWGGRGGRILRNQGSRSLSTTVPSDTSRVGRTGNSRRSRRRIGFPRSPSLSRRQTILLSRPSDCRLLAGPHTAQHRWLAKLGCSHRRSFGRRPTSPRTGAIVAGSSNAAATIRMSSRCSRWPCSESVIRLHCLAAKSIGALRTSKCGASSSMRRSLGPKRAYRGALVRVGWGRTCGIRATALRGFGSAGTPP